MRDVDAILSCLLDAGLYVNWLKSDFLLKELDYLGHTITKDGIKPKIDKVKAIMEWEAPQNIYQLRSFLGAIGYYRKFIYQFSKIAAPLNNLTKESIAREKTETSNLSFSKFGRKVHTTAFKEGEWTEECNNAFIELRNAIANAPILKFPNSQLPYELMTDASDSAVGAVLMQRYDNQLYPVAYYSQKLTPTELNYPVHELELLAIFKSLKHWRHFLINSDTTIYTDHKPLTHLLTQASLSTRQQRWITFLSDFKVEIVAVKGTKNVVADALSRYKYRPSDAMTDAVKTLRNSIRILTEEESSATELQYTYALLGFDTISNFAPYYNCLSP